MRPSVCVSGWYSVGVTIVILAFCFSGRAASSHYEISSLPILSESSLRNFQPAVQNQIRSAFEAARSNAEDPDLVGRLGMILHSYEKIDLARACYERAHRLEPTEFRWVYYLGLVTQQLGRHREAIAFFRQATELEPESAFARIRLGQALHSAGELQESRRVYEQILEQEPDLTVAHFELGEVHSALGKTNEAVYHYQRAAELAPNFAAAHYALALKYRDLGKASEAKEFFDLYRDSKGNPVKLADPLLEAVETLALGPIAHFERGRQLENEGKLEEAAAAYERTLKLDSGFGQAYVNLISVYTLLGRLDDAERQYHKGLEVNPKLAELHYNYGLLAIERRHFSQAARAFQKALELNPYFADAHNNLGSILESQGKFEKAEHHFRLALENNPGHRLARFNLGRALVREGRHQEGIVQLRKILTVRDARTPTFLYVLADAYVRTGEIEKGIDLLKEAIQEAKLFEQQDLAATMERDMKELKTKFDEF